MTTSFSFGCEGSDEEVDGRLSGSYRDRQEPCDQIASRGSRCIGSGCDFLGSVLHDNRKCKMILQKWQSKEGDGRVLGEKRIHQGDGRCL